MTWIFPAVKASIFSPTVVLSLVVYSGKSGSIVIVDAVIVTRKEKEEVGALESDLTAFLVPLALKEY